MSWQKNLLNTERLSHIPPGLRKRVKESEAQRSTPAKSAFDLMKEGVSNAHVSPGPVDRSVSPAAPMAPAKGLGNHAQTSPGSDDGHTHTAYYDDAGNGYTDEVEGHTHDVRSFMVAPYQDPAGTEMHEHPGPLPRDMGA